MILSVKKESTTKRQKMSSQQVMKSLFKADDGISSEDEDDFDDELSWYESDPEMDALSDLNSETDECDTESEDADDSVSHLVRGKDGCLWKTEPKNVRRTPCRNVITSTPGLKGKRLEEDTHLKSFELFFDDGLSMIVTWTNQKIEVVRKDFIIRSGYTYGINETEVRGLIGVLLFLGVTKSSKESTASVWSTDGTEKPICFAAMNKKRFIFLLYCLRFDDSTTRDQLRDIKKPAPIRSSYKRFYNLIMMLLRARDNNIQGFAYTWLHKGNQNEILKHPKINFDHPRLNIDVPRLTISFSDA